MHVTTSFSDVADEEHFFFTQEDNENQSDEQTHQRKDHTWQDANEGVAYEERPPLITSFKEITKIVGNSTSCSMSGIKANARLRLEQDVVLVPKKLILMTLGQPYEEELLTREQSKHYQAMSIG